jgi:phenylacetate-CoA ligase
MFLQRGGMSVDFKIKDFAFPGTILKMHLFLKKSQWFGRDRLQHYQDQRLGVIIRHCYDQVPYYRALFDRLKLAPDDIRTTDDLYKIPALTKEILRREFSNLTAKNVRRFSPRLCRTSGTSGEPVSFYLDKSSNSLEFCYYWRYWGWAGYKLGMRFAEFSLHHFLTDDKGALVDYSPFSNRVILNPAQLSSKTIPRYIENIQKYKPRFLKGTPSAIFIFALLLENVPYNEIRFGAVFTTGEKVLPRQRSAIEKVFGCKVIDSYAHMERTMAVSQCPQGKYHINMDYGILQMEPAPISGDVHEAPLYQVTGTSLHNYAMPLIRYKTDDLVRPASATAVCNCGRHMPMIEEIFGRVQDILITPQRRFIANSFVVFNAVKGIVWYKIIQQAIDIVTVKIVCAEGFSPQDVLQQVKTMMRRLVGAEVRVAVDFIALEDVSLFTKNRPVESQIKIEDYI